MNFIVKENEIALYQDGIKHAYISLSYPEENTVCFEKVFVDSSLRGQGIAGKLVAFAAEEFNNKNYSIIPLCSYADTWFKKHSEFTNIKHPENGPCCKLD